MANSGESSIGAAKRVIRFDGRCLGQRHKRNVANSVELEVDARNCFNHCHVLATIRLTPGVCKSR